MSDAVEVRRQMRQIGPTYRSVSGRMPVKGESVPYESTLERDFLLRRTLLPIIQQIIAQPIQIPFTGGNGRAYLYTPDFLVYYRSETYSWADGPRPLLVEVKPRQVLRDKWPLLKPKFKAALRYATEQGWDFSIHDEGRIRDQMLDNTNFLARYRRMAFEPTESKWICNYLQLRGEISVDHLLASLFMSFQERAVGMAHLWHLVATGAVECDLTLPLCSDTSVWVPGS